MMLQWGPVFSDVEMAFHSPIQGKRIDMLQWGHVFSDVEIQLMQILITRLNILLQWGSLFRRGNLEYFSS